MKGIISDIQHCSIHDGNGIRTTVFLKGCNMRCKWCHNPETIYPQPEILENLEKCIGCNRCNEGCFSGAKILCGKSMTANDVFIEILTDKPYYGDNGGMTLSGGEPLLQFEFIKELLNLCKNDGINTAIECNMSTQQNELLEICSLCDMIMCDLKIFSSDLHREFTAIDNRNILNNIKAVSKLSIPMIVRTPIISEINDNEHQISQIASFLSSLKNIKYYELLTYHALGMSKNKSTHFSPTRFEPPAKATMLSLGKLAKEFGLSVRIDNILI